MRENLLTRRSFVKMSAIAGAVAASGALTTGSALADADAEVVAAADEIKHVRSCCRACGKMECGVWVNVQNGRCIGVEGDQSSFQSQGNCCTKSMSSVQAAYHPDRLYHPLKRTNPKGEDPGWVRISWDEAYEILMAKIDEVKEQYGGEAIFGMSGTSRIWGMLAYGALGQLVGSANMAVPWQVCKGPRFFGTALNSCDAFTWQETVAHPRVYTQWAAASENSNYDDSCRTVVSVAEKADFQMLVDPRLTNNGKNCDLWLPLRPGTDGAMTLAWMNVIVNNDLIDEIFVKKWTNAPFLVVEGKRTGGSQGHKLKTGFYQVQTALLTEADMKEDGDPGKYMIWDTINDRLVWFDGNTGFWEGETWTRPTAGKESSQKNLVPGVAKGWVLDPTGFTEADGFETEIDPALYGEFEVELKDGSKVTVRPVWEYFCERLDQFDPETVAGITGVPAEDIIKAATAYGTRLDPESGYGNGGIHFNLGIEHSCNGAFNSRLLDTLIGITGNWDVPGGSRGCTVGQYPYLYGLGGASPRGVIITEDIYDKTIGAEQFPLLRWWQRWADDATLFEAIHTEEPYPVKMGWCSTGDIMNMSNTQRKFEALKKLDFFVVSDLWKTPNTMMADLVLPAQHWIETDAPRISQGSSGAQGCTVKAVEPPADTMHDNEIIIGLYERYGVPWLDGDIPWPNHEQTCDQIVGMGGYTWKEYVEKFQKDGWWDCRVASPDAWGTYRRYETGFLPQKAQNAGITPPGPEVLEIPGMGTPTRKMELWCTTIETFTPELPDDILPNWIEPPLSPVADPETCEKYPIIATSGRRIPVYFHSEHRQLPWCRELWPAPRVEINPEDAAELGIQNGDWVWIENDMGKIRQKADLYYGISKGVINLEHSWWFPEFEQADKGCLLTGCNNIVYYGGAYQDRHCGASYLRAFPVKIYKATPENSPFGNPVPCDDNGVEIISLPTDPRLKEWLPNYELHEEA